MPCDNCPSAVEFLPRSPRQARSHWRVRESRCWSPSAIGNVPVARPVGNGVIACDFHAFAVDGGVVSPRKPRRRHRHRLFDRLEGRADQPEEREQEHGRAGEQQRVHDQTGRFRSRAHDFSRRVRRGAEGTCPDVLRPRDVGTVASELMIRVTPSLSKGTLKSMSKPSGLLARRR